MRWHHFLKSCWTSFHVPVMLAVSNYSLEKYLFRFSAHLSQIFCCCWAKWILTPYINQIYDSQRVGHNWATELTDDLQMPSPLQYAAFSLWWLFAVRSFLAWCHIYLFFACFPCLWSQSQKNTAKTDVNEITAFIFF